MIRMVTRSGGPRVAFRKATAKGNESFVWSATSEGWTHLEGLVGSLCASGSGHCYLTEDSEDDATVELSLGERDVLDAARSHGIL
jgi:hypothetical protein